MGFGEVVAYLHVTTNTQFAVEQFVLFLECLDLLFKRSDALFEADDLRVFS